ncbi:forkhead box protein P2-like isoform X3 [Macrobrachium nipponense]|uniref:forkhead box protein P2-like isoform X3 n=1 Tax=Macrobrachium nipponense TaxID=159736 RepID=UPI0030C7AFD2
MQGTPKGRSDAILIRPPIAAHLHNSAVLKMLHEEEGENHIGSVPVQFGSWPPPGHGQSNRPMGFMTKVSRGPGGRPVEWPPRPELTRSQEELDQAKMDQVQTQQQMVMQQQQQHQQQQQLQQQQRQQQVSSSVQMKTVKQDQPDGPNLTTTYPSSFKLKDQPSFQTAPARVVTSQPAFKITQPIRRRGDDKWPPRGAGEPTQEEVREFIKPKKNNRNYEEFFAQNALPNNYAGYRPPPGTQHHGLLDEEEDGVSNM